MVVYNCSRSYNTWLCCNGNLFFTASALSWFWHSEKFWLDSICCNCCSGNNESWRNTTNVAHFDEWNVPNWNKNLVNWHNSSMLGSLWIFKCESISKVRFIHRLSFIMPYLYNHWYYNHNVGICHSTRQQRKKLSQSRRTSRKVCQEQSSFWFRRTLKIQTFQKSKRCD